MRCGLVRLDYSWWILARPVLWFTIREGHIVMLYHMLENEKKMVTKIAEKNLALRRLSKKTHMEKYVLVVLHIVVYILRQHRKCIFPRWSYQTR